MSSPWNASSYENFRVCPDGVDANVALAALSLRRLRDYLELEARTDETSMLNSFASLRRRDAESRTLSEIGSLISKVTVTFVSRE